MVKLLACSARGPGFEPGSQHYYHFRDWISPPVKLRCDQNNGNPQNNQPTWPACESSPLFSGSKRPSVELDPDVIHPNNEITAAPKRLSDRFENLQITSPAHGNRNIQVKEEEDVAVPRTGPRDFYENGHPGYTGNHTCQEEVSPS